MNTPQENPQAETEKLVFVEQEPLSGREHDASDATIGRDDCDVLLVDPDVSRCHARLRASGSQILIEDLESKNGTFVNGERITAPTELSVGDELRFGNTRWRLEARSPS